ncbi:PIN domain-containing protein [Leptospira jelokensis]|uniref:PIN domain-containing protein n=1 Tax=Leptospira jelokensis TaxID=2484931 RepID=A0A4Z0ZV03_9LEPT|nr:PIN domain-containing protein [Leptospira jelokensis]TGL56898.1 PIN domain-containing protein [Leptospira jelokensis]
MSFVLIDSSIWIEYFRNSNSKISEEVDSLIDNGNIYTNEIILTELIPFIKIKKKSELIHLLETIESFKMNIDWKQLREFQILNLKNGINHVGIPDLIILQNVIQNKSCLFTMDKHFKMMSQFIPIDLY